MKIGDLVRHKKKGWIGKIVDFMKRNPGVMVDTSDKPGIRIRWYHRDNLEAVEENDV
tara:strand:+ start:1157 stop:1327 length:171 start_codon:yes stop_codon:yes gene_type:complete